jgi:tripartite ATP-independent transporter DctM subunit
MSSALIGEALSLAMFAVVCVVLLVGFPIAFTLAGTSLAFALLGFAFGVFDLDVLTALASRYFGTMGSDSLLAVPLFVFMGMILERSGIAEQLLTTIGRLFGRLNGGLGYSVVLVGAVLAASTGVVGATVITMGLISLPAMMRAGYDHRLSTGVICASSTLAQIIPPSTVLIFVGDILQGVNQQAQIRLGNYSPDTVSVGELFAGALIPGLILVGLYTLWIVYKAVLEPETCPPLPEREEGGSLWRETAVALVPPSLLIMAVLGSILLGVATPTESGSIGAIGAMVLAASRRRLDFQVLKLAVMNTAVTTSMIFVILLGASVFSLVFRGLGGEALVEDALAAMPGGAFGAMLVVMFVMFLLGFFLDTFEIIFIMLPICGPTLIVLGLDPVWLGVMIGLNLQTSFLTPPFGFTLFYMRGVSPPEVTTKDIWAGSIPWTFLQAFGLALVWMFPATATWLPDVIFSQEAVAGPAGEGSSIEDALKVMAPGQEPREDGRFDDLFGPGRQN